MDDLIDRALSTYIAAEPRPGLEQRVLAKTKSSPRRRFLVLLPAAAIVACALYLTIATKPCGTGASACAKSGKDERSSSSQIQAANPTWTQQPPAASVFVKEKQLKSAQAKAPVPHRARLPQKHVFPSPAPIPEPEMALAHLAAKDPGLAAALVAKTEPAEIKPITIEPLSIQLLDED